MQWLAWPAWLWPGVSGTVGSTTLTVEQLASHTHTAPAAAQDSGGGIIAGGSGSSGSTWTLSYTGGSQQHTHALDGASEEASGLPPYYALSYIIRIS